MMVSWQPRNWEQAWLQSALNTGAWMVSKQGDVFFLCARGPHVKLVKDTALAGVKIKEVSHGHGGHVWAVDHDGRVWVRVIQNPLAPRAKSQVTGMGTTEVVYEEQRCSGSSKAAFPSKFVSPVGTTYDALEEVALPSSRWQWDTKWELESGSPTGGAAGWEYGAASASNRIPIFGSKNNVRRRAWLRTRSVKDPSKAWFKLPAWTKRKVISIAVAHGGVWILLDVFKIAFREGIDAVHLEGRAFETVEEPTVPTAAAAGSSSNKMKAGAHKASGADSDAEANGVVEAGADTVSVGCMAINGNNDTWLAAPDGRVYYREGVTALHPTGKAWVQLADAPRLVHISVTAHALLGIDTDGNLRVFDACHPASNRERRFVDAPPRSGVCTVPLDVGLLYVFGNGWQAVTQAPEQEADELEEYQGITTLGEDEDEDEDEEDEEGDDVCTNDAAGGGDGSGGGLAGASSDSISARTGHDHVRLRKSGSKGRNRRRSALQARQSRCSAYLGDPDSDGARMTSALTMGASTLIQQQQQQQHIATGSVGSMRRVSANMINEESFKTTTPAGRVLWCCASEEQEYIFCIDDQGDVYVRMGIQQHSPLGSSWLRVNFDFLNAPAAPIASCCMRALPFMGDVPLPSLDSSVHARVVAALTRRAAPKQKQNFLSQRVLQKWLPETEATVAWFNADHECGMRIDTRAMQLCFDVYEKGECHLLPLLQIRSVQYNRTQPLSFRLQTAVKHFRAVTVTLTSFTTRRDWVIFLQRWVLFARQQAREALGSTQSTDASAGTGIKGRALMPGPAFEARALPPPSTSATGERAAAAGDSGMDAALEWERQGVVAPALWAVDKGNRLWFCDLVADHLISEVGECSPMFDKCSYRDGKTSSRIKFTPTLFWHRAADLTCSTPKGAVVIRAQQVFTSPAGLVWVLSNRGRAYALVQGEDGSPAWKKRAWRFLRYKEEQLQEQRALEPFAHPSWPRRPTSAVYLSRSTFGAAVVHGKRPTHNHNNTASTGDGPHTAKRATRRKATRAYQTTAAHATAPQVHWVPVPLYPYQLAAQAGQEVVKDVALTLRAAWVVSSSGLVFVRCNVTVDSPIGSSWLRVESPELAASVCARDGSVTILTMHGHVYTRVGFDASATYGTHWETDYGAISSPHLTHKRPDAEVDPSNALQSGVTITHDASTVCALSPRLLQIGLRSTYGRIVWQCRATSHEFSSLSADGLSHLWGVDSEGRLRSISLNMSLDLHRYNPAPVSLDFPAEKDRNQKPHQELPVLLWRSFTKDTEEEISFAFVCAGCARPRMDTPPRGHSMLADDTVVPAKKCSPLGSAVLRAMQTQQRRIQRALDQKLSDVRLHYAVDPLEVGAFVYAREPRGLWWLGRISSKVEEKECKGTVRFFLVHTESMQDDFWVDRSRVTPNITPANGAVYVGLSVLVPRQQDGEDHILATVIAVNDKNDSVIVEAAEANLRPYTRQFLLHDIVVGPTENYRGLSPTAPLS